MATKDSERTHRYAKEHYDRIVISIPKGNKQCVADHAMQMGYSSVNQMIQKLILWDMGLAEWPVKPKKDDDEDDDIYLNW